MEGGSLSEEQTDSLITYQSITGEEDMERSISTLVACGWDVSRAVNLFERDFAEAPTASAPPLLQPNSAQIRRVARRGQPFGVFWPISLFFRIVSLPFSWLGLTPLLGRVFNYGTSFLGSALPFGGPRDTPELEASRFIVQLDSEYSHVHPQFLEVSYARATERARSQLQFLFVYLHSDSHANTEDFCRNTLCTPVIKEFVDSNFVAWGGSVKFSQGYQVSNSLGATSYPFIALVCCNPIPNVTTGNAVAVLERIEGPSSSDELLTRMVQTLDRFGNILQQSRQVHEQRTTDRLIREEQDAAYLESLAEDQEKERKAREIRRTQEEEELRIRREEQEAIDSERSQQMSKTVKRQNFPAEPEEKDPTAYKLAVRLPDGTKLSRRFFPSDKIQMVLDFVDINHEESMGKYVLSSNFPKKTYHDLNVTLKEAQLNGAMLFLTEK